MKCTLWKSALNGLPNSSTLKTIGRKKEESNLGRVEYNVAMCGDICPVTSL